MQSSDQEFKAELQKQKATRQAMQAQSQASQGERNAQMAFDDSSHGDREVEHMQMLAKNKQQMLQMGYDNKFDDLLDDSIFA